MPEQIHTVVVIGCGVIGMGWAVLFLSRGLKVIITDLAPGAEENFGRYLRNALPLIAANQDFEVVSKNYEFVDDIIPRLVEADFVQENGPERVNWKEDLFETLDKHTRSGVVIASSSSGLPSSAFIGRCRKDPSRILIGHPFNPPHLIPLVEVVPHPGTSQNCVEGALEFYRSLGRKPILLHKEIPGFVSNRLQAAINNEAYSLISRGIVSAEDLDAAVSSGPGLRWALTGPIATNALGGGGGIEGFDNRLDRLGPAIKSWEEDMLKHRFDWSPESLDELKRQARISLQSVNWSNMVAERNDVLLDLLKTKASASTMS
ncbi:putative hydroxyacyl-CoA dehydrogenase [Aureobasidium subglaciale]|nr:putative hydroxyacyl-CoA dehydrogenase [Aureobasidium subglaciale]